MSYGMYGLINVCLIYAISHWEIVAAFAAYGLFYAVDDSQSGAFIADIEPDRRASAIDIYNFVIGLLYLPASLIAGALWATSPTLVFSLATGLSIVAIALFVVLKPAHQQPIASRYEREFGAGHSEEPYLQGQYARLITAT